MLRPCALWPKQLRRRERRVEGEQGAASGMKKWVGSAALCRVTHDEMAAVMFFEISDVGEVQGMIHERGAVDLSELPGIVVSVRQRSAGSDGGTAIIATCVLPYPEVSHGRTCSGRRQA